MEYLFAPGSFRQRTGEDYVECTPEGPVRIIVARINANNTMRTTEQLINQKKEMHLSAFRFCLDEMAMSLKSKETAFGQRRERDPSRFEDDCPTFESFTSGIVDEARAFLERHMQVDSADIQGIG